MLSLIALIMVGSLSGIIMMVREGLRTVRPSTAFMCVLGLPIGTWIGLIAVLNLT